VQLQEKQTVVGAGKIKKVQSDNVCLSSKQRKMNVTSDSAEMLLSLMDNNNNDVDFSNAIITDFYEYYDEETPLDELKYACIDQDIDYPSEATKTMLIDLLNHWMNYRDDQEAEKETTTTSTAAAHQEEEIKQTTPTAAAQLVIAQNACGYNEKTSYDILRDACTTRGITYYVKDKKPILLQKLHDYDSRNRNNNNHKRTRSPPSTTTTKQPCKRTRTTNLINAG
jgi:hypothetical protein